MKQTVIPITETILPILSQQLKTKVDWDADHPLDGRLTLVYDNKKIFFTTVIKTLLPNAYIPKLEQEQNKYGPLLLLAEVLYPKQKIKLQGLGINYADTHGNIFIKTREVLVIIDRPIAPINKPTGNRAFTKTGLKVLFQLLLNKELVNRPQREIAKKANVALGNIPKVIKGLQNAGYLLNLDGKNYLWQDREDLLAKWIQLYNLTLLPLTGQGRYKTTADWQTLNLDAQQSKWGGEAAAELLTDYLRAEDLILYTLEPRNTLIKNYRLLPDPNGSVSVRKLFWPVTDNQATVPPLLVYADLILTNNQRCLDAAQILYDRYVQKII